MIKTHNSECAPAKINLSLRVLGKRADGYHALESLVGFAEIGDGAGAKMGAKMGDWIHATVLDSSEISLAVSGGAFYATLAAHVPNVEDNLIVKAARLLQAHTGTLQGAKLVLEKNLPLMGGLGGGSADAAACLRLLNRVWGTRLSQKQLIELGAMLGSDVPACIISNLSWMTGRGEQVTPLFLEHELSVVLINPAFEMPTGDVFENFAAQNIEDTPSHAPAQKPPSVDSLAELLAHIKKIGNDLTDAACAVNPKMRAVLTGLPLGDALYGGMSGSGASCFMLFDRLDAAHKAEAIVKKASLDDGTNYWVATSRLR